MDNLGQMDVRQTDLTLGCGSFAGLGILMDEKTTIFVTNGELQVTPASFQNSYQKVVVRTGGILSLRNGTYPNNVDITLENDGELHIPGNLLKTFNRLLRFAIQLKILISQKNTTITISSIMIYRQEFLFCYILGSFNPQGTSASTNQLSQVQLTGVLSINDGRLNVSGCLDTSSSVTFRKGSIIGTGQMDMRGSLLITYGDSPADQRQVSLQEMVSSSAVKIEAPTTLDAGGTWKQAEASILEINRYGSLCGDGTLINAGDIKINTVPDYMSEICTNLHNYWRIETGEDSKARLHSDSPSNQNNGRKLKLEGTGIIDGTDLFIGHNVYLGGTINGFHVMDQDISFYNPTFVTGTLNWKCGRMQFQADQCNFNYYPQRGIPLQLRCREPYIMVQGTLQIDDVQCTTRALNRDGTLVISGLLDWVQGTVHVDRATLVVNLGGTFLLRGSGPHVLSRNRNQGETIENAGLINFNAVEGTFSTRINNRGQIICNSSTIYVEYIDQRGSNAKIEILGSSTSFRVNTLRIYDGVLETESDISGQVEVRGGRVNLKGEIKGNFVPTGGVIDLTSKYMP